MTKIIQRPLKLTKGESAKKRVRDSETGKIMTMRTVDAGSETFASDLSHAFRSNVKAALRKKK